MKWTTALTLSLVPVAGLVLVDIDPEFYCGEQARYLSDEDFIRIAINNEIELIRDSLVRNGYVYRRFQVPLEGYEISSLDEFLEANPGCCRVVRDPKSMRRRSTSWLMRLEDWLDGEMVQTNLLIPSDTAGEPMVLVRYFTDECGNINYDRSYTISNLRYTE